MVNEGWIEKRTVLVDKVRELLRFFGVASLDEVKVVHPAAFRKTKSKQASPEALAAWMRQGELQAQKVQARPFDSASLRKHLPAFRVLTCEPPEKFEPELRKRCARCGVAWVVVPHLPKTHVNGAVWWEGDHYVVEMSLRFRWNDIFWFTFFHELGHVLLHGKRSVFIDLEGIGGGDSEDEASEFAANALIDKREYADFVQAGRFTWNRVKRFAHDIKVHPGIVVGRLQHDEHIGRDRLNGLRERFKLKG
jgi:HTH-type transcriptional regulator/antitoxin HigA